MRSSARTNASILYVSLTLISSLRFLEVCFALVPKMLFVGLFLAVYICLGISVHGHLVNYVVSDLLALLIHFLFSISGHFIPPLLLVYY